MKFGEGTPAHTEPTDACIVFLGGPVDRHAQAEEEALHALACIADAVTSLEVNLGPAAREIDDVVNQLGPPPGWQPEQSVSDQPQPPQQ